MTIHTRTDLLILSWTFYSVATFVLLCRLLAKYLNGSRCLKAFEPDDWLMLLILPAYTVQIYFLNVSAVTPTNLFYLGTDLATFTAEDYATRIWGSKVVMLVLQAQMIVLWGAKASLIIMYLRLTKLQNERKYLICLAWYIGLSFLIMELLFCFAWCWPFTNYWAVPTPNIQCSTYYHHLVTNAVFNLSTDLLLLLIVLPLFLKTKMPLRKKVAICGVFSMGIFNIVAAIVSKYNAFTNNLGTEWTKWYLYESSTAILVANLPFVYTLLRRVFNLRSLDDSIGKYGTTVTSGRTADDTLTVAGRSPRTIYDDDELLLERNEGRCIIITTDIEMTEGDSSHKGHIDNKENTAELGVLGREVSKMTREMRDRPV
ncbi:hypothetical protein K461DRAFT_294460 [Myriangium duriaei CBS 260.36]|uniref:Rhodopsin domain-containing protein n=1 Tax=Myriangium duriaei CBS 260.36 TaxID=1168546 RepID=A0A9P4IZ14_9PEZI|nr:hypothetical protein K461DRAFT_294460 [Myriangium duriaei CBS 260.36]